MKKNAAKNTITADVIEELRALVADAEQALASTSNSTDDKINDLRERMRTKLAEGKAAYERMRDSTKEHIEEADEYVRTHPYQTIGLAALAGLLVGVLITRKNG